MEQSNFIIRKTADGSDTLFSQEMDESYHSINGAAQESRHVFIEAGLKRVEKKHIRVFEVGFGTGLNALLTWGEACRSNLRIDYTAIEAFPLSKAVTDTLNYGNFEPVLPLNAFSRIHEAQWGSPTTLEENRFILSKIQGNFTCFDFLQKYDLIYFDAFAPEKQPEMWEENLFLKIFHALNEQGILVTYCAKGEVRRRMQRSGFKVERIQGPPGKREMIRAVKSVL